ncbi:acyl-[acyl-carrier-protein]--UDP-N-acetylglucosamine O-acyltransferase [Caulobacter sp. CCUG 60055]|uniref:acyl-ACP--UDP-N-acetylglucosamine O-acyltransferase n=1 Tax=Caulobacter sp. CCUG 60055 TaxID=2100090 RepID=UPI001FA78392|nr:acyl-ACP--UDP-N-acetylglucosamine O-acyltransferase [Caulobacter sp. CCUG 60055]MCI3178843.1 acyl-[acyl-carrier-protein]--UDP-N-acetylglucosamine O-acyltransferase [Caulobacter sp. CCUG 60055]
MTTIHPTAIVADGARLGADVEVGPYCIVGGEVVLADGVRLISHVTLEGRTEIGEACVLHPFASLGGAPQHLGHKGEPTQLIVGQRNIIREHVTMNTGTVGGGGVTRVGSDGLYMTGSHVAHDCVVGDHVVFANNATLGGHVHVGDYVFMGGLAAAHQFTRIGRYSFIGGVSAVTKDIIPYGSVWGVHAHLEGLNLVGLKRRGFTREAINDLRSAYRLLFADEGTFQERLEDVANAFAGSAEVMEIVGFIRAEANRPLCLPRNDD